MNELNIDVILGDGIGQDVMNEALKVINFINKNDSSQFIHTDLFEWSSTN